MLYKILAVVIIVSVGVLRHHKLKFRMHLGNGQSNLCINIFFFYGLIRIPLHLQFLHMHGEKLSLQLVRRSGKRKVIFPMPYTEEKVLTTVLKSIPISHYLESVNVHSLSMKARIGTDEPQSTVLLCALSDNVFNITGKLLFSQNKPHVVSQSLPDFSHKIFILNMEGIMHVDHVKIILKVVAALIKYKIGKETSK